MRLQFSLLAVGALSAILDHSVVSALSVDSKSLRTSQNRLFQPHAGIAPSTLSQKAVTKASGSSSQFMNYATVREPIRMPSTTPMVPWKPPNSDRAQMVDINSAMYRDGTLMISRFIDEEAANEIIAILLWMRSESSIPSISLYFNVPGGLLRPALAIYDLIQQTKEQGVEIETCNLGLCTGMGSFLCAAGTKGMRRAMPNSRFLLQRMGLDKPVRGQATDIVLEVKNIKMWNDRCEKELAKLTGQPVERIQEDLKRDFYLSSDEAVQYGLIDEVLMPAPARRAASKEFAALGAFEGEEEQKYQGREAAEGGGWGSQQQASPNKKDDDDDGPKIAKG
ncbi:unnamed protein product [Pseudo-nitzschia multistriata]|uniref:ATP-dependent Clp protease proteolytic subunit n=1 Tax=Pseudo-nitzschia multistriata TaxID=183589 RepID=A0A448Z824_9STRA|nr:unnamed protein product [Pseudo-nitzschia multistriata]